MPQRNHHRLLPFIVIVLLIIAAIFFIISKNPRSSSLFAVQTTPSTATKLTNAELLQSINEDMQTIDTTYNFNLEPAAESLQSPSIATSTQDIAQ